MGRGCIESIEVEFCSTFLTTCANWSLNAARSFQSIFASEIGQVRNLPRNLEQQGLVLPRDTCQTLAEDRHEQKALLSSGSFSDDQDFDFAVPTHVAS